MHMDVIQRCLCAAVLWFGVQALPIYALDTGFVRITDAETVANGVDALMASPGEYAGKRVEFRCRFAALAELFKPVNTEFTADTHVNFAVWPEKAILWDTEARKAVLPTLYAEKSNARLIANLKQCNKYDMVEITGTVVDTYAGYPWVLVTAVRRSGSPNDRLTDAAIAHMVAANDALRLNAVHQAAVHLEMALEEGMPSSDQVEVFTLLSRAYHAANRLEDASRALQRALLLKESDYGLHMAMADMYIQLGNAEKALHHATTATDLSGPSVQAYGIMAEAAALQNDATGARDYLAEAERWPITDQHKAAMLSVRRARVASRIGDSGEAYAAYDAALAAMPGEAWLWNEAGLFFERTSILNADPGMLDVAISAYNEAAALSLEADPLILWNLAESMFRKEKAEPTPEYTPIRETLARLFLIAPEFPAGRILEGRVLFAEGRPLEAEASYQTVVTKVGSDADALMAMAEAYMDLSKYDSALAAVHRAKTIQAWNARVQALSGPLSKTAEPLLAEQIRAKTEKLFAPIGNEHQKAEPQPQHVFSDSAMIAPSTGNSEGVPMTERDLLPQADPGHTVSVVPQSRLTYELDGRRIQVDPGHTVISSAGQPVLVESIATSAMSAPLSGVRSGRPPVTEVRLDRSRFPLGNLKPLPAGSPDTADAPIPSWDQEKIKEQGQDEDSALHSSITVPMDAFASLTMWADVLESESAIPPFSFAPDQSPVLISGIRAPENGGRDRPVRNTNVYRRAGNRIPAEVIEKETVSPKPKLVPDTSFMTPAADGTVRRAEVRLPSSAMGIGMASDYQPGKDTF